MVEDKKKSIDADKAAKDIKALADASSSKSESKTQSETKSDVIRSMKFNENGSNGDEVLNFVQYVDSSAVGRNDIYAKLAAISTQSGTIKPGDTVSILKGGVLKIEKPSA